MRVEATSEVNTARMHVWLEAHCLDLASQKWLGAKDFMSRLHVFVKIQNIARLANVAANQKRLFEKEKGSLSKNSRTENNPQRKDAQ